MAQNYDLTQTGPELQARVDQVFPNRDAIEQETVTREAQDESLETSLKAYTDTEQARAEAAEGALDTRVSANEVDIDLLKSQYEALTQSDIIVGPLPSTGQPNKIYRVPGSTYYTDYMWANGGWVKLAEYSTLDGYVYKGIATPSGTPVQSAEAVFYFAVQPGTYTNYGGLVVTDTIAILKYNGTEWTKDDLIGIDDEPTAGSDNLVTSGAVAASVVYDISAANAVGGQLATYADLSAALDGGANVPVDVRKGGMEIKFVQSSDKKYVQARCMAQNFTTDVTQWQGVDDKPTAGSDNLVKSGGVYEVINGTYEIVGYTEVDNLTQKAGDFDAYYITSKPSDGYIDKMFVKVGTGTLSIYIATAPNPGGAITANIKIKVIDLSNYQDGSVIEIPIDRQLESNQYIGFSGKYAFYFGQAQGWNLYRNNDVASNYSAAVYYTGRIHGGIIPQITNLEEKTDVIEEKTDVIEEKTDVIEEKIDDIEEQIESLKDKEIYNPILSSENAYSSDDGYSVCTVPAGTVIKSVKVCSPDGTTPVLEFAELINDTLYGKARFTLNAGAGSDTYVETEINYKCETEQYVIMRKGFYFEVLETTENIPYIVGIYREGSAYTSQNRGRVDINYKVIITSSGEIDALSANVEKLTEEVEDLEDALDVREIASDISMFENIGFCGDSYTAGMIVVSENPTVTATNVNLCWGKILERTHGVNSFIYAKGGVSVVDVKPYNPNYLDDADCLTKLLSETAKNLYVISLGHNDCYISAQSPTIYGKSWTKEEFLAEFNTNYRSIISQIAAHAPGAKIILCKQSGPYARMGWGTDINNTIGDIGEDLGLPVLDPNNDRYLSSTIYEQTMVHDHPVFSGYAGMAKAFDRQFSWATVVYWDYFKAYTGL